MICFCSCASLGRARADSNRNVAGPVTWSEGKTQISHCWGDQASVEAANVASKHLVVHDDKFVDWSFGVHAIVTNSRLLYIYGLIMHSFSTRGKDKALLRDGIQKGFKVLKEYKYSDTILLKVVADSSAAALRFKYSA